MLTAARYNGESPREDENPSRRRLSGNLISEAALSSLGEELVMANSGKGGAALPGGDDFAAILLDVRMPDMDGFETAERFEAVRDRTADTYPFLTGYRNEEHFLRIRSRRGGFLIQTDRAEVWVRWLYSWNSAEATQIG
jgi:CheY-like chemotaxis protein